LAGGDYGVAMLPEELSERQRELGSRRSERKSQASAQTLAAYRAKRWLGDARTRQSERMKKRWADKRAQAVPEPPAVKRPRGRPKKGEASSDASL